MSRPDVNSIANHARTDFTFELLARDEILLSVLEHHSNLEPWQTLANGDSSAVPAHHPDSVCSMQDLANLSASGSLQEVFDSLGSLLKFYALAT